jgi:hypothetical protein
MAHPVTEAASLEDLEPRVGGQRQLVQAAQRRVALLEAGDS